MAARPSRIFAAGDAPTDAPRRLLLRAAEVVARAGVLRLSARRLHDGAPGGAHLSTRRGGGVEFAEHRDYAPGDDLRHLDWHATARRDRLLVKRFQTEVHSDLWLVIDGSASMALSHATTLDECDKWASVTTIAMALALIALREGDAVGLEVPGAIAMPPRGGPLARQRVAEALSSHRPGGDSGLPTLRPGRRGRCSVIVFSDVLAPPEAAVAALGVLVRAGAEVTLAQTLHPLERTFAFDDLVELHCEESGVVQLFDPRAAAEAAALMAEHRLAVRQAAAEVGVRLIELELEDDPSAILRAFVHALGSGVPR